jgi:hypothetical protein
LVQDIFQDSEETIAGAEINDTSYESQADFHGDETKQKLNLDLKNVDVVNCNLANLKSLCK